MKISPPRLGEIWLDPELLQSCGDLILRYRAVPIEVQGNRLRLGMLEPNNQIASDDFSLVTGFEIDPLLISEADFAQVEEYVRHHPPKVFMMDDFPPEAYQSDTAESAANADYVLEMGKQHRNIRMVSTESHLLCYYDEAEHPLLRFPGFVRNAFYRRWKQQAGLNPDHPSPCEGRLHFQGVEWKFHTTAQEHATLTKVTG